MLGRTLNIRCRQQAGCKPRDHGRGYYNQQQGNNDLHREVERFHEPTRRCVPANACCALELHITAAQARRSTFPDLMRAHVRENRSERSDPASATNRDSVCNSGSTTDLVPSLKANKAEVAVLVPSRPGV